MSQRDFSDAVCKLSGKIFNVYRHIDCIVGIANGGLAISNFLAYAWNLPHFEYNPKTIFIPDLAGKRPLLVDDIVDTGATLKRFKKATRLIQGEDFFVATLHWCPEMSGREKPDFYVLTKKKSEWIVYPWEDINEEIP